LVKGKEEEEIENGKREETRISRPLQIALANSKSRAKNVSVFTRTYGIRINGGIRMYE